MQHVKRLVLSVIVGALCVVGLPVQTPAQAQTNQVTITVGISDFQKDVFNDTLLKEFEAANPDIRVKTVTTSGGFFVDTNQDNRFESYEKTASAADVIPVNQTTLTSEATQAGYFFDLAPLVAADTSLNTDDFYKAIWQSFQWDRGIWALPNTANVILLSYSKSAFDQAGLAYPNEKWTLQDFVDAIKKLTIKDDSGKITRPGISSFRGLTDTVLYRSLLDSGLYDSSTIPNTPRFDRPDVIALIEAWTNLQSEGYLEDTPGDTEAAMSLTFGGRFGPLNTDQGYSLLPGGTAGLMVQGYAVSSGTQYPEAAYKLAKFLTGRAELSTSFGGVAARKTIEGTQSGTFGGGPGGGPGGPGGAAGGIPQELIDQAVENGLPTSELRYVDYLYEAVNSVNTQHLTPQAALQAAEQAALEAQNAAIAKKDSVKVVVATPAPDVVLEAGQIALNFAVSSNFIVVGPNADDNWSKLIQEFTASDPQVKQINFNTAPGGSISDLADKYDCFYMSYNDVQSASLDKLLNLDPFMGADTSFNKDDFVGGLLAQVQRDNKVWGLPIMVEPAALRYDAELFQRLGIAAPGSQWTVSQFTDALKTLRGQIAEDKYPFTANAPGGSHLLTLIAAFGGLPIDYRTTPPTINFTDPATVDAIRQVLELAKQKYIEYSALASNVGGAVIRLRIDDNAPIYTALLNAFALGPRGPNQSGSDPYKLTSYPRGNSYNLFSYSVGTAYISANAQNPDACYRWISNIARHPELFNAMPARRSLINDPARVAAQGEEATAFYNAVDQLLADPNTISMPSLFGGGGATSQFMLQWLYRAFDRYVLEGSDDLENLLKDAEASTKAYLECVAGVPSFDPSSQNFQDYISKIDACRAKVDNSGSQ